MNRRSLLAQLEFRFQQAFQHIGLDATLVKLQGSDRPELGDFQCNTALALAKQQRVLPRDLATRIVQAIGQVPEIASLSIEGPGFINIKVSDAALNETGNRLVKDRRCGVEKTRKPRVIILDFGGMNVAKPMHVGHLRSSLIGDCLQRMLRFKGERVKSDVHLGDWGTQMGLLIAQLETERPTLPYFNARQTKRFPKTPPVTLEDLQVLYPRAANRAKEDAKFRSAALAATLSLQQGRPGFLALWKHFVSVSLASQKDDMRTLGIHFDWWKGESDVNVRMKKLIRRLEKEKFARRSDGALIIDLQSNNHALPPLLLAKSDGAFLYATSDLATLEERIEKYHAQKILYVVDQRQSLHFEQLVQAATQLGWTKKTQLQYIGFGTMNGADGKPFKTRAGGVMRLNELVAQMLAKSRQRMQESKIGQALAKTEQARVATDVAFATLKFADLNNHRSSDYIFNLDQFTSFVGKTGPTLLYSGVRMRSLLAKARSKRIHPRPISIHSAEERQLLLHCCSFPSIIEAVLRDYTPNTLTEFLYQLSQTFNRFYEQCPILTEEDVRLRGSRLSLVNLCEAEMVLGLQLLGIHVPKRM